MEIFLPAEYSVWTIIKCFCSINIWNTINNTNSCLPGFNKENKMKKIISVFIVLLLDMREAEKAA